MGFPCGSAGKESTCSAGALGSIPGLGRFPGEGKGYPFQYSGLKNFMDCIVQGSQRVRHDRATFTHILTAFLFQIYIYINIYIYLNFVFLLKDNCFTILCWFLPYICMNQPWVYICPVLLKLPPISHPVPSPQVVTEHWVELPVSHSKFPLALYFTYGNNVYVSMLLSQLIPASSSSSLSTTLFPMSTFPLILIPSLFVNITCMI